MLDFRLQKYRDFKGYLDEYLNGEISKNEILEILEILRKRYERQHFDLLEALESDLKFLNENGEWIQKLREAARCFEDARDAIEELILEDNEDLEEALELFKEGNRLLNAASTDIEDILESNVIRGDL